MKKSVKYLMGTFLLYAGIFVCSAGEIEQFISETMAERRAQNAQEAVNTEAKSEIQQIVLPESKLSAKTKSLKSRNYRYDKAGRLVSVVCEACPELNESYVYDKQGNILENVSEIKHIPTNMTQRTNWLRWSRQKDYVSMSTIWRDA